MKPAVSAAAAIAVAGAVSAAFQRFAEAADQRRFAPPGRMAGIGSRRLHILAAGQGTPAVVIVSALGTSVLEWVRIVRAVSAETTVCVYDRAGTGWSDPPRGPVTLDTMADDLHRLLRAAGIPLPCVIAGHSLGGIIARRYQACYPADVAGMLLIDSSHEEQERRLPSRAGAWSPLVQAARRQRRILGARRLAASRGLLSGTDPATLARETVPEHAAAARAISLSTRQRRIDVRELLILARLRTGPPILGSLPLTVLTAASPQRRSWPPWTAWDALQGELAALSSDSQHLYAINAGHHVHLDDPQIVQQAIQDLARRCRRARTA